ncbi:MAG: site-2 protease family protein [Planctomycetota bacterium]|nr:site-2 protease family protein [Planctomycetota bacterium]MDA1251900.1 site-2 protease family protein [Planctomycetota bacterium]
MDILAFDLKEILNTVLHILYVALGLGLVIFFHELGHFAVAKWCGVLVERFSLGFGPILWSFKKGDTEYALSAVPFGGYVKMLGQDDMDPSQMTSEEIAEDPRSYTSKTVAQRMAIISAGVIMNIVTGLLFFALAFRSGVETSPAVVGSVITGKPGWEHGLRPGDTITDINGRTINSFADIMRGTTLSRGDLKILGHHRDGTTFEINLAPDRSGERRMIGIAPSSSVIVGEGGNKLKTTTKPGTAASAATPGFEADDTVRKIGGDSIEAHSDLREILARRRSEKLEYLVERKSGTTATISVEPQKFLDLGIRADFDKISSVLKDSPAAKAGFLIGDRITSINGSDVGSRLDPFHLPDFLESLAGTEVTFVVKRIVVGSPEPQQKELKVTPSDAPAWLETPISPNTPLSIPSLGIAYHLASSVLSVSEGSPANRAGVKKDDKLKSMKIQLKDVLLQEVVGVSELTIPFDKDGEKNMAYALWQVQQLPGAEVQLIVAGREDKPHSMTAIPTSENHYLPKRGILFLPESITLKGDTWGDAFSMATHHTVSNALDIYLTLRSLFTGDLSIFNLRGPVGIAQVAFQVSKQGPSKLLLFLGFLSINLAVLNFLPIPVLDGGHMVFLIWEGVTRKPPSEAVHKFAQACGLLIVVGLMITVIILDIFVHGAQ